MIDKNIQNQQSINQSSRNNSSFTKNKIIRKCGPRKKITKIVHTICFTYLKSNGQRSYLTNQKIIQQQSHNQRQLLAKAQESAYNYSQSIIQSYYKRTYEAIKNNIQVVPTYQVKDYQECLLPNHLVKTQKQIQNNLVDS